MTLKNIGEIADQAPQASTRRHSFGNHSEQSWLWPLYAPFHPVRMRWNELESRGELTPELADDLQAEMYEAAYAVLGESRSHRATQALVMYEKGRLRTDRREAVGMANFIKNESARRAKERG